MFSKVVKMATDAKSKVTTLATTTTATSAVAGNLRDGNCGDGNSR